MSDKNIKILVVDDFELARNIAKKELADLGFTNIEEATNGNEAFAKLSQALSTQTPFNMVLSDWHMPECSGLEFLKKIRTDRNFKQLPFIMISAESETDAIVSALQFGANDFICKPFTKEALSKKIQRVLSKLAKAAA